MLCLNILIVVESRENCDDHMPPLKKIALTEQGNEPKLLILTCRKKKKKTVLQLMWFPNGSCRSQLYMKVKGETTSGKIVYLIGGTEDAPLGKSKPNG